MQFSAVKCTSASDPVLALYGPVMTGNARKRRKVLVYDSEVQPRSVFQVVSDRRGAEEVGGKLVTTA